MITRVFSSRPDRLYGSLKNVLQISDQAHDPSAGIMEQQCNHPLDFYKGLGEINLVAVLFQVCVMIQFVLNGKGYHPHEVFGENFSMKILIHGQC